MQILCTFLQNRHIHEEEAEKKSLGCEKSRELLVKRFNQNEREGGGGFTID